MPPFFFDMMKDDYLDRLTRTEMTYYRDVYKESPRWKGESLEGKRIVVYCEQGLGDTIQFARYFKYLNAEKVILHCQKPLHRLMSSMKSVDVIHDKLDPNLPDHDYHVLSMSLPFVLDRIEAESPYLHAWARPDVMEEEEEYRVGIAWEGNPNNEMNEDRSCHLSFFDRLPGKKYMLQNRIYSPQYIEGCEDMDLYSIEMQDMQDTAELIAAMDVVVSVDTSVLHLAGAMGKPTVGLLCHRPDARWSVREWYPTVKLIAQKSTGCWDEVFNELDRYFHDGTYRPTTARPMEDR